MRPRKPQSGDGSRGKVASASGELANSVPGERLQKLLASAGIGSRRSCETWIAEGRVKVNGEVVTELGTRVDPARDKVTFDGRLVRQPLKRYYIALNKPRGVVCSRADSHADRLITDLVELPSRPMLRPVGRLDSDSEGLIFLTDDGDFLFKLTHPKYHIPKTYRAVVRGVPDTDSLGRISRGIMLDDGPTEPAKDVHLLRVIQARPVIREGEDSGRGGRFRHTAQADEARIVAPEPQTEVELTIFEGRNRQVRRMFAAIGHPVVHLTRIRIGQIRLKGLPVGAWRHLTSSEISGLSNSIPTQLDQENKPAWHARPHSRPPRAQSSPALKKRTRP